MAYGFLDIASTPSVMATQAAQGSRAFWTDFTGHRLFDRFTAGERDFIAARDSFYMASVLDNDWPYAQHRGGPTGVVKMLDEYTFGFVDYCGNRQYISLGNVQSDGRVSPVFVDYPRRHRLKLFARAEVHALDAHPALAPQLVVPDAKVHPERIFLCRLDAFDWNCPQHISLRYTAVELDGREGGCAIASPNSKWSMRH